MDKYGSYEELRRNEPEDHFAIRRQEGASGLAVMAPHGGGIEPGTSEIAKGVAGTEHAFYAFEGLKASGNRDLHITSTNFDEPTGVEVAREAQRVLAVHGCSGEKEAVYVGGRDGGLKDEMRTCLLAAGFRVEEPPGLALRGTHPDNMCNRNKNRRGVQIELSEGLRKLMFEGLSRKKRVHTKPTYEKFVSTLRQALIRT